MTFNQYSKNKVTVSLNQIVSEQVSLLTLLNADTLFLLLTNNTYHIYRLRSQCIYTGEIPKQFIANQFIKFESKRQDSFIYLANSNASICKLSYKQNNNIQIRNIVQHQKSINTNECLTEYRFLGNTDYILAFNRNLQNGSCSLFVYDWQTQILSNTISIGNGFYNPIISNFYTQSKNTDVKFVIAGEQQKKICYNYIRLQIQNNEDPESSSTKSFVFILKDSGKRTATVGNDIIVKACILSFPYFYSICNNKQGPVIYSINIQENSSRKIKLNTGIQKEKGIIRKVFGISNNQIMFNIHRIAAETQEIYFILVSELNKITAETQAVHAQKLHYQQNSVCNQQIQRSKIRNLQRSIDGYCFYKSAFLLQKVSKLCLKQNENFKPQLYIEVIFRVPKKFFYSQMSESLGFPTSLIYEILNLL